MLVVVGAGGGAVVDWRRYMVVLVAELGWAW